MHRTLLILSISIFAWAAEGQPNRSSKASSDPGRSAVSISSLGQWTEYSEPGVMQESGTLYGGRIEWQSLGESFLFNWDSQLVAGRLRYEGKNWSGQSVQSETQDLQFQSSPLVGIRLSESTNQRWAVLIGPRLRLWQQVILATGGYPRELTQFYIPLSIRYEHGSPMGARFRYGLEYAPLVYGEMLARLSVATNDIGDMKLFQSVGAQIVLLGDWSQTFEGGAVTRLGTYLRSTEVEKSTSRSAKLNDKTISVVEPANRTIEMGLSAGLSF